MNEIPNSYLVALLLITMTILRSFDIDTFVTAALSGTVFYILGKHVEQTRK